MTSGTDRGSYDHGSPHGERCRSGKTYERRDVARALDDIAYALTSVRTVSYQNTYCLFFLLDSSVAQLPGRTFPLERGPNGNFYDREAAS
jgi:hypothetical protein